MVDNNFLDLLFDEGESFCAGSMYANKVIPVKDSSKFEFFSINPLNSRFDFGYEDNIDKYDELVPRRADINVSTFRNFLFEMDSIPLETQKEFLFSNKHYFSTLTYSGGKSIHAVISLDTPLKLKAHDINSTQEYSKIWTKLSLFLTDLFNSTMENQSNKINIFDIACKNASRLSRFPGFIRSNGNKQELLYIGKRVSSSVFNHMLERAPKVFKPVLNSFEGSDYSPETVDQFMTMAPKGLVNQIDSVSLWAASDGMYPFLYKICLWAIDHMSVRKEIMEEVLQERVYPVLLRVGYSQQRLNNAINDAYKNKRVNIICNLKGIKLCQVMLGLMKSKKT